jgi:hypothetical protein
MAQYKVGTVAVTNGSAVITAVDPDAGNNIFAETAWLTEVASGDLFYLKDDDVAYVVNNVTNDKTLSLTTLYQGTTITPSGDPLLVGAYYAIHRDFSTNYSLPIPNRGDIGLPVFIQMALQIIDTEMKAIDDRVTALEP